MATKKYLLVFATLSVMLFASLPVFAAGTASISLSPLTGSYKVGQTFSVKVLVDPGSDKIDMVRSKLTFSSDTLEIKNFSIDPTFSFQAGGNGFDNNLGTFSWGAGTPGGMKSAGSFGLITFYVKKAGDAKISIAKDSLALSAGVNNFNGNLSSAAYTLSTPSPAPKQVVKNTTPVKNTVQEPATVQPAQSESNAVETQIVPKIQSQSFSASLLGALNAANVTRVLEVAAVILVLMLMGFTLVKIIKK